MCSRCRRIVTHRTPERDYAARDGRGPTPFGGAHARSARRHVRRAPRRSASRASMKVYRRLFTVRAGLSGDDLRRLGSQALDRIASWSPSLLEEIDGIAHGSGIEVELIGALNARTELLAAAAGECSTIACLGTATASGSPLGVQTWDWHEELRDGWLVLDDRARRRPPRRDADRGGHRRQDRRERLGRRGAPEHPRPPRRRPARRRAGARAVPPGARRGRRRRRSAHDGLGRDDVGLLGDDDRRRRRRRRRRVHRRAVARRPRLRHARRPRRAHPHEPLPDRAGPLGRHDGARVARLGAAARPRRPPGRADRGADRGRGRPHRHGQPPRRLPARSAATPLPGRRSATAGRRWRPWSSSRPQAEMRVLAGGPCQRAAASTTAAPRSSSAPARAAPRSARPPGAPRRRGRRAR